VVPMALLLLMCISLVPGNVEAQSESFEPSSVSVYGSILDNYANLTYEMYFDNSGYQYSREVNWFFGLQSGIRLSNVSMVMGEDVYWGQVIPESEAIMTYEESLEMGVTAVLVTRALGGYFLRLNVANNTGAMLCVFVEGLIVRNLGLYSLEIPLAEGAEVQADFAVDLSIISHYGPLSGYGVTGLSSMTTTDIPDGIRIEHSRSNILIPELLTFEYALDRQEGGSQLLTYNNGIENFFAYLLAPSISEIEERASREYVFVLDTSGSMSGTKIQQAKTAFSSMIEDLNTNDIFNVVSFSTNVDILWSEPHSASSVNIASAQKYVSNLDASGSTNFYGAGITALSSFTEGEYAKVILLLSDGLPTAGETSSEGILSGFQEANCECVSISTVAFGYDADETLMANVALQNNGFFAMIETDGDASSDLLDFYKTWATPVANSFSIDCTGASEFFSLQPLGGAPFFNGSEVVISGRYGSSLSIVTSVEYTSGTEIYVNSALKGGTEYPHIEFIWAQYKLSWMLEMARLEEPSELLREQITDLAMHYGLVVDGYTGMILVVEEVITESETIYETTTIYTDVPNPGVAPCPTTTASTGYPLPAAAWSIDPLMIGLVGGVGLGVLALGAIALIVLIRRQRAS